MEPDIKKRIVEDFGGDAVKAIHLMEVFEAESKFGSRVSRCVVVLANGDMDKLREFIGYAEEDWRDVIMWGEKAPLEFNKPF